MIPGDEAVALPAETVVEMIEPAETFVTEDGYIVTEEGEVQGVVDMPDPNDQDAVAEWVTERWAKAAAKKTGIEAERDQLIKGVKARFDPEVNKQVRKLKWLEDGYKVFLRKFTEAKVKKLREKNPKAPASIKLKWAMLQFIDREASLEVADPALAANSLLEKGEVSPIVVHISLKEVFEDPGMVSEVEGRQTVLGQAILDLVRELVDVTEEDVFSREGVFVPGVTMEVKLLKDVDFDGVEGILRKARDSEDLWNFYVKV